jgi:hypothetical protein
VRLSLSEFWGHCVLHMISQVISFSGVDGRHENQLVQI